MRVMDTPKRAFGSGQPGIDIPEPRAAEARGRAGGASGGGISKDMVRRAAQLVSDLE